MKFFVYTVAANEEGCKDYEFVEEASIADFAMHEYDPAVMQYSGIAIEATDFDNAMRVYQHPTASCGEFLMMDEPSATAARRALTTKSTELQVTMAKVQKQLEYLRCMLLMKLAASKLVEANRIMNKLAEDIYDIHNRPPQLTPQQLFDTLSTNAIKHTIRYYGDTKKIG